MNARILPLLAMTILFMFAWNGDQKSMHAAIARRDAVHAVLLAETYGTHALSPDVARHVASSAQQRTGRAHESDDSLIPLPAGISPGHYQAVSQAGLTARIHVPNTVQSGRSVSRSRDLYISDSASGDRWYLVRIQNAPVH